MAKKKVVDDENYDPSPVAVVAVVDGPLLKSPTKSLAQLAYEQMIAQYENPEVQFTLWEEMNPLVRHIFEERAASLEQDALFEQCVRAIQSAPATVTNS